MDEFDLLENVREVFETCRFEADEPCTVAEFQKDLYEEGERVATQEDIREACEMLVDEGVLAKAGTDAYYLSDKRVLELDMEDAEWFANAVAEHELKRIGKK